MLDRSEANRELAKALAYAQCGKIAAAREHLTNLVYMFSAEGITPYVGLGSERR